jgi:ATP-binding cassette subfamily A (ABC1) protein 3
LYLKDRFGIGYNLTIFKEENHQSISDNIHEFIIESELIPEFISEVSNEIRFRIPKSKSHLIPEFFAELEQEKERLGISRYEFGLTSLFEVFDSYSASINPDHI